ncbi:nicotinamide N-methyltransferase, putative [Ixodes scapularis]|uniref:Nicotinamide N-methyltransferase, putative n=1 Tax=Ixodes scapularis TaxID=6945 RepID=B7QAZ0_IXOSC|nr:nicotinamide N-methyltransferase, putative [Ixodes scapularis]|eukprot:XP_002412716.1 nicotinamide N-methyltransferase, putative [Ixodes scapularis]
MKPEALREVHKTTFLPLNYIKNTENYVLYRFQQEELHHIFNSDLIQGSTLVDIGSGPTINFVFSATKRFQDIVVSDLVERNRLEVEKWLRKSVDSVDWSFRAEHVADLEGHRCVRPP